VLVKELVEILRDKYGVFVVFSKATTFFDETKFKKKYHPANLLRAKVEEGQESKPGVIRQVKILAVIVGPDYFALGTSKQSLSEPYEKETGQSLALRRAIKHADLGNRGHRHSGSGPHVNTTEKGLDAALDILGFGFMKGKIK